SFAALASARLALFRRMPRLGFAGRVFPGIESSQRVFPRRKRVAHLLVRPLSLSSLSSGLPLRCACNGLVGEGLPDLGVEIRACVADQRRAELVAKRSPLQFDDCALGKLAELERPIGNAD